MTSEFRTNSKACAWFWQLPEQADNVLEVGVMTTGKSWTSTIVLCEKRRGRKVSTDYLMESASTEELAIKNVMRKYEPYCKESDK